MNKNDKSEYSNKLQAAKEEVESKIRLDWESSKIYFT